MKIERYWRIDADPIPPDSQGNSPKNQKGQPQNQGQPQGQSQSQGQPQGQSQSQGQPQGQSQSQGQPQGQSNSYTQGQYQYHADDSGYKYEPKNYGTEKLSEKDMKTDYSKLVSSTKKIDKKSRIVKGSNNHSIKDEIATNSNAAFKLHEHAAERYSVVLNNSQKRAFATIIQKLSEDNSIKKEGDEEWDVNEIMMRKVSHKHLTTCKCSYMKNNIMIIFDTSSSCIRQSAMYIALSEYARRIGCLEIFQAPNGYILADTLRLRMEDACGDESSWHPVYMSKKTGDNYLWNIHGRTILFFGDYDGRDFMIENSKHNTIHYFNPTYHGIYTKGILKVNKFDEDYPGMTEAFLSKFKGFIYPCNSVDDLIRVASKLHI